MGYYKYLHISFLNKRHYNLIKTYSFYKRDIWGMLRVKRSVNYKKAIYSILRVKRRFYYLILYIVYNGVKFYNKRYNYKANLLFNKKRLKLFYGFLRDTYLGKLGLLVKRKMGNIVDYFYSILERRLDVLIYRSLYSLSVQFSRYFICNRGIKINNKLILKPNKIVKLDDVVILSAIPFSFFFFQYISDKSVDVYRFRFKTFKVVHNAFVKWEWFKPFIYFADGFFEKPFKFNVYRYENYGFFRLVYLFFSRFYMFILLMVYFRTLIYLKYKSLTVRKTLSAFNKLKKFSKTKPIVKETSELKHQLLSKLKLTKSLSFYRHLQILDNLLDVYRLQPKLAKLILKQKVNLLSSRLVLKTVAPIPVVREIGTVVKMFIRFKKHTIIRKMYELSTYRLYGLVNLRIRFRKFFYLIQPRMFKGMHSSVYIKKRSEYTVKKPTRWWSFSRNAYNYLKKYGKKYFVYKAYPSYMEVNYKSHMFLLVRHPTVLTVTYPFSFKKNMLYNYFKLKAYF